MRRVEELQHSDVIEGLPQGVHAKSFPRGFGSAEEKLRKDRPLSLWKNSEDKLCLEDWKEASQVCKQVEKFCARTLSHFVDCIRKNRRSISSRENQ